MIDEPTTAQLAAIALATSLAKQHVERGGSLEDLFSAFVGVVVLRDKSVGLDCLTALDRFVSASTAQPS